MRNISWVLLLLLPFLAFSQEKATLSGYAEDSENGERLIGASIYIVELELGTTTNAYGFYSITIPKGTYKINYSYVGFNTESKTVELQENTSLNVKLGTFNELQTVVVSAEKAEKVQEKTQMSTVKIDMDKVNSLPALMGEKDLIKTIQLLPGVQSGTEGASGLYVRGGGPDQNLILLDGVPVYNASHLFGFFSVFNADAINSVELVKGGFPARYGGRLSSVLDIRMREGNMNKFQAEGSVGVISSKLSIQGPIKKGKTSFIVSGRRTYLDILARPLIRQAAKAQGSDVVAGYYFYDLNGKINHKFSDRSRLFFSSYMGNDKFYFDVTEDYTLDEKEYEFKVNGDLKWGNRIAALRWNYMINPKLFSNTTLTYSRYNFGTSSTFSDTYYDADNNRKENKFFFGFNSGIDDWTIKTDFDYLPSPNHYVRFGVGDIYHTFTPGVQQLKIEGEGFNQDSTVNSQKVFAHEAYAYIEDDFKVGNRLKIHPGLHFTVFNVENTSYTSLQPRIAARYLISKKASIKASYAQMAQFLHLLSNPSIGLPTDLWVPATRKVLPENSHQWALGYAQTLFDELELTLEGYYKTMDNLIEYGDGTSFYGSDQDWENKVESGRGWSYGGEFLLEKKTGKFSGWVGYTLSWTQRQFEEINFGKPFYYRYDRRHDIGLALTYKKSEHVDFGLVWVYGTGNAFTLGLERYRSYDYQGGNIWLDNWNEVEHIDSRNNFRAPAYHRLDLGVNIHKERKWGISTWSIGLYNAYSRQNPFYIFWGYEDQFRGDSERVLKQISIFPVIPSISYSFKIR